MVRWASMSGAASTFARVSDAGSRRPAPSGTRRDAGEIST
jgi:hypothetical protein